MKYSDSVVSDISLIFVSFIIWISFDFLMLLVSVLVVVENKKKGRMKSLVVVLIMMLELNGKLLVVVKVIIRIRVFLNMLLLNVFIICVRK